MPLTPKKQYKFLKYKANIALNIFLTLITCGIYNFYWNLKQMRACNDLLGREEFVYWHWLLFVPLTCGIYHVVYQYQMGSAILELQTKNNSSRFDSLPILSCLLTIFMFSIVVDGVHQNEINKLVG